MATNKREFKKYADALGAAVIDEMISAYYNVEGADKDKITEAINKTLGAIGKAKSNANVFFDKGHKAFDSMADYSKAKHAFFRQLFDKIETDFADDINAALKDFNAALPASVKAQEAGAAKK